MRVLVCGSRTFTDDFTVEATLATLIPDITLLIHGGARGADSLAGRFAARQGIPCAQVNADWKNQGKRAGIIRNQFMLDQYRPDRVYAFVDKPLEESRGTSHMVSIARAAGVPTWVVQT